MLGNRITSALGAYVTAILCMKKNYLILYFPSRIPQFYEENTHMQIPGPLHKQMRKVDEQTIILGSSIEENYLGDSQISKLDWKHLLILQSISADSC